MAVFEDMEERRESSGVAKGGLITGIIGDVLSSMALAGNASNAARIDNINQRDHGYNHCNPCGSCNPYNYNSCNEDHLINRYDAAKDAKIAKLETELALKEAEDDSDRKDLELYKYFINELKDVRAKQASQDIHNQRVADSFKLIEKDIELEKGQRICSDNAIVNYANNTFYAQRIADVKTTNETTIKKTYNPLPVYECC